MLSSVASKAPGRVGLRYMSNRPGKTTIHKLIEEEGTVLLPGVHDALAACVVQKVGFKAGFVSGFGVSASHLGKPDFGLLTYGALFFFSLSDYNLCFCYLPFFVGFVYMYMGQRMFCSDPLILNGIEPFQIVNEIFWFVKE